MNRNRAQVNEAWPRLYLRSGAGSDRNSVLSVRGQHRAPRLVVIGTGIGEADFTESKGAAGQFHNNLKAAGIDRNQVDAVIISHFHGDHINGLLTPDSKPAFPNAEIMVPAPEWKYFTDDAEMSKQTGDPHEGRVRRHAWRVRRARPQGHAV